LIGLILVAIGAILEWAVNVSTTSVNIHAIGWILMLVGLIVFLVEMLIYGSSLAFWRRTDDRIDRRY